MTPALGPVIAARSAMTRARNSHDPGSASVYVVVLAALLVAAASATVAVGGVMAARHRVATAADLGALAAADVLGRERTGGGSAAGAAESPRALGSLGEAACTRAGELVKANGAELSACIVVGERVEVEASWSLRWGGRWGLGRAVARAAATPGSPPAGAR